MLPESIAAEFDFDGRHYAYDHTEETTLGPGYVADKTLVFAVGESIQNQLDECLMAGTQATIEVMGQLCTLRDNGRGVDFDTILILGESGKRHNENTVGQFGEGEVISFLVCLRLGIPKVMTSQCWYTSARWLTRASGKQVMVFDVWVCATPRDGTLWQYSGTSVPQAMAEAYCKFVRHEAMFGGTWDRIKAALSPAVPGFSWPTAPTTKCRLITDDYGELFSRGVHVGSGNYQCACSYNLKAVPGRDRAAFRWSEVEAECAAIWAMEAGAEAVKQGLRRSLYNGYPCWEFGRASGPAPKLVKQGVALYLAANDLQHVVWAGADDSAAVADASALPGTQILRFHDDPPAWLQAGLPHVKTLTKLVNSQVRGVKMPPAIAECAQTIMALAEMPTTPLESRKLPENVDGGGNLFGIIIDPTKVTTWTWAYFVTVIVHELAHVASGNEDCTRDHANWISKLSGRLIDAVAADPHTYIAAHKLFTTWQKETPHV